MAITIVQRQTKDAASATSTTISFPGPTLAGNCIIVALRVGGSSTAAITDDKSGGSNTYNTDVSLNHSSFGTSYIFSAPNAGAATVLTCTLTGGATTMRLAIYEYSGLTTSTPLDKTSSLYTAAGGTSVNSGNTATTTQASELLFGTLAGNSTNDTAVTAGTSQAYAIEDSVPSSGGARLTTEDVVVSATGAFQADFGSVDSTSDHIVLIATYKAVVVSTVFEDDSFNTILVPAVEPTICVW